MISFKTSVVFLDLEDIFNIAVLPPLIDAAKTPRDKRIGKLNGEMIRDTP